MNSKSPVKTATFEYASPASHSPQVNAVDGRDVKSKESSFRSLAYPTLFLPPFLQADVIA